MTQNDWRQANRLSMEGLGRTYARVAGDVRQHMILRQRMQERGWLRGPRLWLP